jgi:hypothetical protein
MKVCRVCSTEKPLDQFHNAKAAKDGKVSRCKTCAAEYNKQWQAKNPERVKEIWKQAEKKSRNLHRRKATRYGLTVPELDLLFEKSSGKCMICERQAENLFVDHCHATGKVRGILCLHCNTALGNFNDNIDILKKAMEYLAP